MGNLWKFSYFPPIVFSLSLESGAGTIERRKPAFDAEENEQSEKKMKEEEHNGEFGCTDLHVSIQENESGGCCGLSRDSSN